MCGNFLFHGDNLDLLRRHVKDESVALVNLAPPLGSNQDYNVLVAERDGYLLCDPTPNFVTGVQ